MVQSLWRTVRRFLKKLKLPYDLAIPLLGVYPEKNHNARRHGPQGLLQHYSQQLKIHQQMHG